MSVVTEQSDIAKICRETIGFPAQKKCTNLISGGTTGVKHGASSNAKGVRGVLKLLGLFGPVDVHNKGTHNPRNFQSR